MQEPRHIRLLLLFILCSTFCFSQERQLDSLKRLLSESKHDTMKCYIMTRIVIVTLDADEMFKYNQELKKTAIIGLKKSENDPFLTKRFYDYYATALNNLGLHYELRGELIQALTLYDKSLEIFKNQKNDQGVSSLINNIAAIHFNQGNIPYALKLYEESRATLEKIKDTASLATVISNIGYIYYTQGDPKKAREAFDKSLELHTKLNNPKGMLLTYDHIGGLYSGAKDYKNALIYFQKAMLIARKISSTRDVAFILQNIATNFYNTDDNNNAKLYYDSALVMFKDLKDPDAISQLYTHYAKLFTREKKYPEAIDYASRSLKLSEELGYPTRIQINASLLYKLYKKQGDFSKALGMYELSIKMRDSVNNIQNKRAALQTQFKYDYEKKEAAIIANSKIENERILIRSKEEKRTQNLIIIAVASGLALTSFFLFFIFRSLQEKKKANKLITEQKILVEEKQKEIVDSINYAQRIQKALLASKTILDKNLENYFILFKPKDIVSGDFYWATNAHGKFYIIAADSTGHGVPGAFMSLLNISFLNEAINEKNIQQPDLILDHARKRLIQNLAEDGSEEGGKDGMDCSLMCFDKKMLMLEYTNANNPILIIRNNEVIELPADKMPVGKSPKEDQPFTYNKFELQKGDIIYSFTDGYTDQFGGPRNKKFMFKNLKEQFIKQHSEDLLNQKEDLERVFIAWKGGHEQLDDVLIIGIKI